VYHNFELACDFLELQRAVMYDPSKKNWFMQYANGTIWSVGGQIDRQYGYQTFAWNYSNPNAANYVIDSTMANLAHSEVDGSYLDDAPFGLPLEKPTAVRDLGMTIAELSSYQKAAVETYYRLIQKMIKAGKYSYQQLGWYSGSAEVTQSGCTAFMRARCAPEMQNQTLMMHAQSAPGSAQVLNQTLAAFLIARSPVAFIGFGWPSKDNMFSDSFLLQPGEPTGLCIEERTGVFSRQWTNGKAVLDCGRWQAELPFERLDTSSVPLKSDDAAAGRVGARPEHSWETLPVAWHSALSDAVMSPDAVKNLSKFPLITLEKSAGSDALHWKHGLPLACQNGTDLSACGCCEEDLMIAQARQINALNPKAHIVAYMNSIIAHPWYRAAHKFASNSSWWLRNSSGGLLNNIRENPTETWRAWNFAVPEVGDLWIKMCLNVTKSGVIDGYFTVAPTKEATSLCPDRCYRRPPQHTELTSRSGWPSCRRLCRESLSVALVEAGSAAKTISLPSQRHKCRIGERTRRTGLVSGCQCYVAAAARLQRSLRQHAQGPPLGERC
jgi:hypothetical protein